jgi:hypothetical protein
LARGMSESTSKVKITPASAAAHDGILFVSVALNGKLPTTAGDPVYAALVVATIEFASKTNEKEVKLVLGETCIEVHKEPHCIVALAFKPGSPVVKSVQRMMRKLAKACANPVERKPEPEPPKLPTPAAEVPSKSWF